MQSGKLKEFCIEDDVLKIGHRMCLPEVIEIREKTIKEAHCTLCTAHPGSTKMYQDLQHNLLWNEMKKDITEYVHRCLVCQQVKDEHKKPQGLVPLSILE